MSRPAEITPMRTAGAQFLIERTNRESGSYQWVRETLINAFEAKATHVEYGIEWQAARGGVYRRTICDDGIGMSPEQLVAFFNTFGSGGKKIGGVHDNFGVGAKTSLLPWNRLGVVVISWQGGKPAMIWMKRDSTTGEYGLRVLPARARGQNILETVFTPFNDEEHGIDWRKVKPPFIKNHGTCVILLGNTPTQDTILGDPYRDEADIKGISSYLNHRIWDMRDTGVKVFVTELRSQDKNQWPNKPEDKGTKRLNHREVLGARYWVMYDKHPAGKPAAQGAVPHSDGATFINWYLWDGERPAIHSYAPMNGFIAVLYRNELYNFTEHHATYRSFGITERSVRSNLWLVVHPPTVDPTVGGVYPRTDRNALLYKPKGVGNAAQDVPMLDWAAWFAEHMPQEIQDAISKARGPQTGSLEDESWRQRLADRFGSRWKIKTMRATTGPGALVKLTPSDPTKSEDEGEAEEMDADGSGEETPVIESARPDIPSHGTREGDEKGKPGEVSGGIPSYIWVPGSEFDQGMLVAWSPHDPQYPEGVVLLNSDHPMIDMQIKYWQSQYAEHHADAVAQAVRAEYGQMAVSKVAHSEHFKGIIPVQIVETDMRSEPALTMSLLGLIAEENDIQTKLDSLFRKGADAKNPS